MDNSPSTLPCRIPAASCDSVWRGGWGAGAWHVGGSDDEKNGKPAETPVDTAMGAIKK